MLSVIGLERVKLEALCGAARARLPCRFAPPLIHFTPEPLAYSVPLSISEATGRPNSRRGQAHRGAGGRLPGQSTVVCTSIHI
jgi:hypothetical protein